MIRKWRTEDSDQVMALWLESTTEAHSFIPAQFWKDNESVVRDQYIPQSDTWVYDNDGKIIGFISIMNGNFIGALFVEKQYHGKGIGAELMKHAQNNFPELILEVYEENKRAVAFYIKWGFKTIDHTCPEDTGKPALMMKWTMST